MLIFQCSDLQNEARKPYLLQMIMIVINELAWRQGFPGKKQKQNTNAKAITIYQTLTICQAPCKAPF